MSLIKKGRIWHYDFWFQKKHYQGSTHQTNINKARLTEAKERETAALEHHGIAIPKTSVMLKEYLEGRFLEHVRQHNTEKPLTVAFYEEKSRRLLEYSIFQNARLSEVDESAVEDYKTWRSKQAKRRNGDGTISNTAINRELATLRKALNLAYKWKLITRKPEVSQLPGEKGRDFVLSGELETEYLQSCSYPLQHASIFLLDWGLRPAECVALKKEDIGADGVTIRAGKSKNAVRSLPHTARTLANWQLLLALWPASEFLFPGHKQGTHLKRASLDHLYNDLRAAKEWPKEFVLYSLRHTFGTRLAESGASPFDIMKAMGHSDIRVSQKYVHPSATHLSTALKRKELLDQMLRGEVHETASKETESR